MKKISLNEEFHAPDGNVWMFFSDEGKIKLKSVRKSGKIKEYTPPTIDEVKEFFKSKGYTEESAIKFHEYYSFGDWKDSKGNQVKNWKQKAASVWFKSENKAQEQSKESSASKFMF